jgi:hypothetical protein
VHMELDSMFESRLKVLKFFKEHVKTEIKRVKN